jgi:hypothetical protein
VISIRDPLVVSYPSYHASSLLEPFRPPASTESNPVSYEDWQRGTELSTARQSLYDAVEAILKEPIACTSCRALDMNVVRWLLLIIETRE